MINLDDFKTMEDLEKITNPNSLSLKEIRILFDRFCYKFRYLDPAMFKILEQECLRLLSNNRYDHEPIPLNWFETNLKFENLHYYYFLLLNYHRSIPKEKNRLFIKFALIHHKIHMTDDEFYDMSKKCLRLYIKITPKISKSIIDELCRNGFAAVLIEHGYLQDIKKYFCRRLNEDIFGLILNKFSTTR